MEKAQSRQYSFNGWLTEIKNKIYNVWKTIPTLKFLPGAEGRNLQRESIESPIHPRVRRALSPEQIDKILESNNNRTIRINLYHGDKTPTVSQIKRMDATPSKDKGHRRNKEAHYKSNHPNYGTSYYFNTVTHPLSLSKPGSDRHNLHVHIDFPAEFNRASQRYEPQGARIHINYETEHTGPHIPGENYFQNIDQNQLNAIFSNADEIRTSINRLQSIEAEHARNRLNVVNQIIEDYLLNNRELRECDQEAVLRNQDLQTVLEDIGRDIYEHPIRLIYDEDPPQIESVTELPSLVQPGGSTTFNFRFCPIQKKWMITNEESFKKYTLYFRDATGTIHGNDQRDTPYLMVTVYSHHSNIDYAYYYPLQPAPNVRYPFTARIFSLREEQLPLIFSNWDQIRRRIEQVADQVHFAQSQPSPMGGACLDGSFSPGLDAILERVRASRRQTAAPSREKRAIKVANTTLMAPIPERRQFYYHSIPSGSVLMPQGSLFSPNQKFHLTLKPNGKLVLYQKNRRSAAHGESSRSFPIWSTPPRYDASYFTRAFNDLRKMHKSGVLALYGYSDQQQTLISTSLFPTNICRSNLTLEDNGDLIATNGPKSYTIHKNNGTRIHDELKRRKRR